MVDVETLSVLTKLLTENGLAAAIAADELAHESTLACRNANGWIAFEERIAAVLAKSGLGTYCTTRLKNITYRRTREAGCNATNASARDC